jgi:hypothetical protein
MNRLLRLIAVTLVSAGLPLASADAETVNCTAITTLPYTITSQGVYCLTGHLNTAMATGTAISVNTSNVVIDLNGFKLGGLSAGAGTTTKGIFASQRQNITIRNGTVRGFYIAISLEDVSPYTTSQGHVIEDIRADLNTYAALNIGGTGTVLRNNQIVTTGGTTVFGANADAYGISVAGPGTRVLNNDVINVTAVGVGSAVAINLATASNSMVVGNRVGDLNSTGQTYGVYLLGGSDIAVRDNIISGAKTGAYFNAATGKYSNNLLLGVTTPFSGGTDAGGNN